MASSSSSSSSSPPVKRQRTADGHSSLSSESTSSSSSSSSSDLGLTCKPPAVGSQSELDVGIRAYIRDGPEFFGVLKARFSDFHVREVDRQGNIIRLTKSLELPEVQRQAEARIAAAQAQQQSEEGLSAANQRLCAAIGADEASRLIRFLAEQLPASDSRVDRLLELCSPVEAVAASTDGQATRDDDDDNGEGNEAETVHDDEEVQQQQQQKKQQAAPSHSVVVPADKDARKTVHECIRTFTEGRVASSASEDGTRIVACKATAGSMRGQAKRANRFQDKWPAELPPFLHFTLLKVNVDTQVALNRLALLTGVHQKTFAVAGTKDKRGITVQRVSAHMVNAKVLLRAQAKFEQDQRQSTLRVSDFTYEQEPLRLGELSGNYFEIVVRQIVGGDYDIASAALSLQTKGFINYFGMQRFGIGAVDHGTHRVGIALLNGAWKQAFDSIMYPQPHESPDIVRARRLYIDSSDAHSALRALPKHLHLERSLLQALIKHNGTNHFTAITDALPRNVRLMYIHAFQSFVWNEMVSLRLTELPRELVPGDLVKVRPSVTGRRLLSKLELQADDEDYNNNTADVIELKTAEDCAQYSWEDLVMPLPGVNIRYPNHSVGRQRYADFLTTFGLNIDDLARGQKDLTLAGNYRHVVVVPKLFQHVIHYYDDPQMDLLLSDLERLEGKHHPPSGSEQRFKAVTLKFALPSACYATMCIREFTKLSSVELR